MSQIVSIERARTLRALSAQSSSGGPFDAVVFLSHFLSNDGYATDTTTDADAGTPSDTHPHRIQQLVMQSPELRLCVSLGGDTA